MKKYAFNLNLKKSGNNCYSFFFIVHVRRSRFTIISSLRDVHDAKKEVNNFSLFAYNLLKTSDSKLCHYKSRISQIYLHEKGKWK